jgi:ABC-2 type transport system permease protein
MNKPVRINQLWQLTKALSFELTREPGVLFWGILFPILMSLGLGLAFTRKPETIRKVAVITTSDSVSQESELMNFLEYRCKKKRT